MDESQSRIKNMDVCDNKNVRKNYPNLILNQTIDILIPEIQ